MSTPGTPYARVDMVHQPGIIIFVHGVNSDGEWYDAAESGLLKGLSSRMGLDQALSGDAVLRPVAYAKELKPDGNLNREVKGHNFITDPCHSPVIRFRWGYKAAGQDGTPGAQDEVTEYGGKIYLNELEAWGGGPFQNGTSALPYMWGLGLDDRVFWWLYANMFPVDGREVYASPPRAYFAHAAHRLKELIKAIRDKQVDCPITVVCHSQGNMVTLAAALLGEKEKALADTYVLCNPPYSLESLGMDKIINHDDKSAVGQFGSVTTEARTETFKRFLEAVKLRANQAPQSLEFINRYHGFKHPETGNTLFELGAFPADPKSPPVPGQDRDNRGRVFLYCNPHDQVIGVSPVQGIGWRGVSQAQLGAIGAEGVFHQRVWATPGGKQNPPFAVGAPDWTGRAYRYVDDHHTPGHFWNPPAPRMKFELSLNPNQSIASQIITVLTAPIFLVFTRLVTLRINDEPKKDWAVPITAPVLQEPLVPHAVRYGSVRDFDEGFDPARDALARADDEKKLKDDTYGGVYQAPGQGNADSEAALRYEHQARIRRIERERDPTGKTKLPESDQRAAVTRMLQENPNATDHSTILTNAVHAEKVLAYDVAIGWVNPSLITEADMLAFRQLAHWMMLEEVKDYLPAAGQFMDYWARGFYNKLQLQHTYTMEHMAANAPGITDARERSLLGAIKG
jgi:pimeloyl-ACP methyl ester carboxylesterase